MNEATKTTSDTKDREIIVSRLINAPVELVWKVWTTPEHIKNWWGPNGFSLTNSKMDVKPGGEWVFVMHGPDGVDYPNKHIYKEIVKYKKIVKRHDEKAGFTMTVTFAKQGNKTLLTIQNLFDSAERMQELIKKVKADEGLKQNVDKLESYLGNPYIIERTFDASVSKVWKAITDNAEMKQWFFDIPEFKPVVGFEFQFFHKGKDGNGNFLHKFEVMEVVAEQKLSYTWAYDGVEGYSIVAFELIPQGNKTTLRLTHSGLATFPQDVDFARHNFEKGWTNIIGTSLQEYLAKAGS